MRSRYEDTPKAPRKWLRLTTTLVIVAIVGLVIGLWLGNNRADAPSGPSGEEQTTIEKDDVSPVRDAALEKLVTDWASGQSANYGIVVEELTGSRRTAAYQADHSMVTASTYKVFLVYSYLNAVQQGAATLDQQLSIGYSAEACIDRLLLRSENDCAWALGDVLGWGQIDAFLEHEGFTATKINNYDDLGNAVRGDKVSTADDEARLMKRLQQGDLLDEKHTAMIVDRLKRQVWRERVPAGVPEDVVVADKPGWLDNVQNDAAIVYGPKSTYVIIILSDGSSTAPLADLSAQVYEYLQR